MARIRKIKQNKEIKIQWLFAKYERLSKEDMVKGDSRSIISQNMTIENHINNLLLNGENVSIADTYIDDGTSGMYDNNRISFQRMITDIESGKINAVIVCDLSRMFRNDADQKYYLEYYFRCKKIRVISCSLPQLDTFYDPNSIYKLDVKFQGVMNANYVIENSIKIKERLTMWRKQGAFVGSFAPYGYKKDENDYHVLIVDDEVSEVVKDIFKWFVYDGLSIRKIVEKLNALGIVNPSEYKRLQGFKYKNPSSKANSTLWNERTVRNTLERQYYIGNMDQHRSETKFTEDKKVIVNIDEINEDEIVLNTHEPIIDKRTFALAQNLLTRDMRIAPDKKNLYLFSGFLICGDCHKAMTVKKAKNIVYYYCSTYLKRSKIACTKHTIRENKLKDIVLKVLQFQISLAVLINEQVNQINCSNKITSKSKRIEQLLASNTTELKKQANILDNVYYDWKNGEITREQYQRVKQSVEVKTAQIDEVLKGLMEEKKNLHFNIIQNNKFLDAFIQYQNITGLEREILVEFIDKIYIYENNYLEIKFDFQDEYRSTLEFIDRNK